MVTTTAQVFERAPEPPPVGSTEFSLHLWETVRSRGIAPTFAGRLSDDEGLRREFLVGARMMGYELVDLDDESELERLATMRPKRYAIQPQQLWLVDALNAEGYDEYVVEIVRRASKTTTIFCWILGRCACRPDYQVTFSAQNGVKSSARLREWKNRLDRTCPDPEAGLPPWRRGLGVAPKAVQRQIALFGDELGEQAVETPPTGRGFRILMGEVGKGIYFDNGSQFLVFKPDADAYRGEAGDISWLDESQEIDPEEGAELLAGLVPLQDTREGAALVVSGTAGEARVGPLWDRVNRLRNDDPDIGGVDYCAPEDTPWEIVEDEDSAIALLLTVHPGIGTLTTEEKMRRNWRKLERPQWAREYLSLWPESFGTVAVDAAQWIAAGLASRPARPSRVAFGMSIKPGGGVAAICAAWRTPQGVAYIEVVQHRGGTRWMVFRKGSNLPSGDESSGWLQYLSKKYRGATIAYDRIGEGEATGTEAARLRPAPRMVVQSFRDTSAGCVQILRDLERGTLRHFNQVGLNNAVEKAAKREVRGEAKGIFLWTPSEPGADITTWDAATRALRNWDQNFARATNGNRNRSVMGD